MGKTALIIGFVILMTCTVWAQQDIPPTAVGNVDDMGAIGDWVVVGSGGEYEPPPPQACGSCHAVLEFDISGFNASQVCRATLSGLEVISVDTYPDIGDGSMTIRLYDLADAAENGIVDMNDFDAKSALITSFSINSGSVGTVFNNVDVTDAVLHDLSDPGDYSGFILISHDAAGEFVVFDPDKPTLTLFPCDIPTLSQYGIAALVLLMAAAAFLMARRRRNAG